MKPQQNYPQITTDETLRETVQHGLENFPFCYYLEDVWNFDFHCIDWHWHHDLEFIYVTHGTAICFADGQSIQLPQDFGMFINSGVLHRYEAASSVLLPNIVFSPTLLAEENSLLYEKYIAPILSSHTPFQIFSPEIPWQKKILELLKQIFSLYETMEKNEKKELYIIQIVWQIWELLFDCLPLTIQLSETKNSRNAQARLQIMMQYIHDHYQSPLTLEEIASSALIGKSSALQIFQSGIHLSPVAYLIQYRLDCAAHLLHTTEKSISLIAEETGFSSTGYFCRKFKQRYNISPGEYRKKH